MKKYGIFSFIIDLLFFIGSLIAVCAGEGSGWDYGCLFFTTQIMIILIVEFISSEVKIRKRMKQIKEERENQAKYDGGNTSKTGDSVS